jgi:hypothetical protein
METVCFSEMLASTNKSAWHQNPADEHHDVTKSCLYANYFYIVPQKAAYKLFTLVKQFEGEAVQ